LGSSADALLVGFLTSILAVAASVPIIGQARVPVVWSVIAFVLIAAEVGLMIKLYFLAVSGKLVDSGADAGGNILARYVRDIRTRDAPARYAVFVVAVNICIVVFSVIAG